MSTIDPQTPARVTLVERFTLRVPIETFTSAVRPALARLEREGISALRSVHFWARPEHDEVGAVLEFSDADRNVEHMNMIGGWPEFLALPPMIKLEEMRVYGPLPAAAEA